MSELIEHEPERLVVGDRVRFDGRATRWLVRAESADRRYSLLTASFFGKVAYSVIDWGRGIRGPINVIGQGMGIGTTSGPDPAIDEAIAMLEDSDGGWTTSHRNNVPVQVEVLHPRPRSAWVQAGTP